jgi:proliferating cell nuclear antigen
MDNSHVALVSVKLHSDGFALYRCDRPIPLGVNLGSLTKVLKCAKDDDKCTLKATDDGDVLSLKYEAQSTSTLPPTLPCFHLYFPDADRVAEYDMKLMDIDADTLGIPDTDYDARVTMLAAEFTRIVRDLSSLGESVRIEVSKEGVRFASDGEAAQGNILLKQTDAARERYENYGKDDEEDDEVKEDDDDETEKEKEKEKEKPKKTKKKEKVKKEEGAEEDEDEEMANGDDDQAEFKAKSEDEDEGEGEEEVSDSEKKKRKRPAASSSVRPFLRLVDCPSPLTMIQRRRKRNQRKPPRARPKVAGCISRCHSTST